VLIQAPAIVIDTSVLLNFVRIERVDLLECLKTPLLMPADVLTEVTRAEHRMVVNQAIADGILMVETISAFAEVALFADLARGGRLGPGERATLAVALARGITAAVQDRPAHAELRRRDKQASVVTTEDIVRHAIHAGVIAVPAADALLLEWRARHRFASRLTTFG
jgi:predicted nucleic acid-binding protein